MCVVLEVVLLVVVVFKLFVIKIWYDDGVRCGLISSCFNMVDYKFFFY